MEPADSGPRGREEAGAELGGLAACAGRHARHTEARRGRSAGAGRVTVGPHTCPCGPPHHSVMASSMSLSGQD